VTVAVAGEEVTISTEPAIQTVWTTHRMAAAAIIVDIPIGLPEDGPRACDEAARSKVGSRYSSVFATPSRGAVEAREYQEARTANEEAGCGGLGSQSWGLVPRIREVDVFCEESPEAAGTLYESHPEVCYRAFSGEDGGSAVQDRPGGYR
jgi:predicted RNase H-like nuclease